MAITAEMVKTLREKTGAGMMDCKKALSECAGEEEKAIAWLREKGLSKAAKKAGRATSEGLSVALIEGKAAVLVEVLCETDFVARSDKFQDFAKNLAKQVLEKNPADVDALAAQPFVGAEGRTVTEALTDLIAILGENMQLGRFKRFELPGEGGFGTYVHSNNKLGVLVEFAAPAAAAAAPEFAEMAKNVAMQIAAANPMCLTSDAIPAEVIEKEKAIYKAQAMAEGKPENIAEKMVTGRMQKFFKDVCLLEQPYIKDDSKSVKGLVAETGKALGAAIEVTRFVRLSLGEDAA